jgi:hypothetical protein
MNPLWKNSEFCQDLLGREIKAGSRESLITGMVGARRRQRHTHQLAAISACAIALIALVFSLKYPNIALVEKTIAPPPWKIASQPFPDVIASTSAAEIIIHTPKSSDLAVVQTERSGTYTEISDEQLLSLFQGRPVALVKDHGHAELEFLDETEDTEN